MTKEEEYNKYLKVQRDINKQLPELYGVSRKNICYDGIYDPKEYFEREKNRVLVILKEAQCTKGVWSPVDTPDNQYCIKQGNKPANTLIKHLASYLSGGVFDDHIRGIGYINISKKAHFEMRSYDSELKTNFNIAKEILYKQINAINPNFILFGNTFGFFWNSLFDNYKGYFYRVKFNVDVLDDFTEKALSFWKKRKDDELTLIQVYHPSSSKTHPYKYLTYGMEKCNNEEFELITYSSN